MVVHLPLLSPVGHLSRALHMVSAELNDPNWQAPPAVQRFRLSELSELSAATCGFDKAHEIAMGGFGKMFVGNFKNGKSFAIKRAAGHVTSTQGFGRVSERGWLIC
jgi:hypothetical protein